MPDPKDLDISEPQAQPESYARMLALLATRPLAGAAGNFASPAGTDEDILSRVYHSGAVQGALSFAGGAPGMIHSAGEVMRGIPYVGRILAGPPTDDPGSVAARQTLDEFAARHGAEAEAARQNVVDKVLTPLGVPEPVTPIDQMIASGAGTAGSLVFPTGISKIPGAIGHVLSAILPSAAGWKIAGPLFGTLGAGIEGAKIARGEGGVEGHIEEAPRTQPAPAGSGIESLSPVASVLPPAGPDGKSSAPPQPMPGAGQPAVPFGGSAAAAAPVSQLTVDGKQYQVVPPDLETAPGQQDTSKLINYGYSQGTSGLTVGGAWAASIATGAALLLGLRYGGKGLAWTSDVGRAVVKEGPAALIKPIPRAADRIAEANAQIARQPTTMDAGVSVPSPAGVNEEVGRMRAYWADSWDEAARIGDSLYHTPAERAQFRAFLGTTMNDSSLAAMHVQQARTGIRALDGVPIQAFDDYKRAWAALDPAKEKIMNEARFAANEMDVRRELDQRNMRAGTPTTAADRMGFTLMDDAQLNARIALARNDPEIARVMQMSDRINIDGMNAARDHGLITAQEHANILATRPNYLSSFDNNGNVVHAFGKREILPWGGLNEINLKAIRLDEQHYYKLYEKIAQNKVMTAFVDRALAAQRANPLLPKMFTESRLPNGTPAPLHQSVPHVTINDANGTRFVRVNHQGLYRAMTANVGQVGQVGNIFATARRLRQTTITGILALAGGRAFPLVNLPRNMVAISAQAGPNAYRGVIDKFIKQRVAAGKPTLGIKGYAGVIDPLSAGGVAHAVVADSAANLAKHFANVIHPDSKNWFNAVFRNHKGDAWVDHWHQTVENQYRTSVLAEEHARGVTNLGSHGGLDPKLPVSGGKVVYTPGDSTVPTLYHGRAMSAYVNTKELAKDIFNVINDGAHSFHYRLNRDNPALTREQLAHEVRSVAGDPAVRGSGKYARALSTSVDYFNTSLQANDAMLRAFERAPIQTAVGAAFHHTLGAAASIFSMLAVGSWAINHASNLLSTTQRSNAITIYHGEGKYSTISLEPAYAVMYPLIHESLASLVGAWQVHEGEPAYDRLFHAFADMFSHRVSYATVDATGRAAANAIDIVQLPGALNAVLETATARVGHPTRVEWHSDTILHNMFNGRDWWEGIVRSRGDGGNVPDQSHADNATLNVAITNLVGVAAKAWTDALAPALHASFLQEDMGPIDRFFDVTGRAFNNYGQLFADGNPSLNILWQSNNASVTNTPLADGVQRAMTNIREVAGFSGDVKNQGLTSARGEEIITPEAEKKLPTDPVMLEMYRTMANFGKLIAKDMQKIQDYREVIDNAKGGEYYANEKRAIINNKMQAIQEEYESAAAKIDQLNAALSHLTGGRMVDVRKKIDWKAGVEQFPPPTQF